MKITSIKVYKVDLPLKEGAYKWSAGKSVETFDSSVVQIDTDAGISGFGEVCPLGPYYLPSYARGVRTGIQELGPHLIGRNPLEIGALNTVMDYHLKGHPYVKSPIDMACWDILGKVTKQSVCTLLGGRYGETVDLYRAISQLPPELMKENVLQYKKEGYKKFQLKVGGNPDEDIARIRTIRKALDPGDVLVADANTGWLPHEAIRIANAVQDLDVYIEQPCLSYDECMHVRQHCSKPFVLDENIDDIDSLVRAHVDRAADVVNLKISKLGGLTKAKQARDLCVTFGLAMTLEDTWGSDIVTAAIAHLAHSTPEKYRFTTTDFNSYNTVSIAAGGPQRVNGTMQASTEPGLGITPHPEVLGKAIVTI
ncbi:uncharacterized protein LOC106158194 [Lingula anatina]|uniref:Uncharacterized protein LOC106158194 n=1 Tax=Lingula anatina TaxID=7574 RepID=A0A1S3HU33_LINAN|nr:uncharacterized protein LOC106158194 [Lingula anatina]|eukprot:XP_013389552.1 uncharacterized protein LOC106158194 [Lingula anatina]